MKKPLTDVIFASEKRKNVLLFLQDGPKEMDYILKSLNTTRPALLPQIKVLEEHYLVSHCEDMYELTVTGKLIVDKMLPLVSTADVFDADIDYWGTRNLDFIPPYLFNKISMFGKCKTMDSLITDLYGIYTEFHEASLKSESLNVVTTFFFPNFIELFHELKSNNVAINFVISPSLLGKIRAQHRTEFTDFIKDKLMKFFVYKEELDFLSFGYNDYYLLIRFLKKDDGFDNRHILCSSPSALDWGKEFFEYYLKGSTPITEI